MTTARIAPPPAALLQAVEAVLHERLAGRSPRMLGPAVRRVSLAYRREQGTPADLQGDREAIDARLAFFLPRDFSKLELPLRELQTVGALPKGSGPAGETRVLDLGAGLGTSGLCAALYLLSEGHAQRVVVDALDVDTEALSVAQRLAAELADRHARAIELRTHCKPLERVLAEPITERYDFVLLGLVLNELSARDLADKLAALCDRLEPGGALIVLEPALRETSRALQGARDALVARGSAPYVFAPCLHARSCPLLERERDWCHERIPLPLPKPQAELAREAGLREEDLTFSYLTLRNEPRSLAELAHDTSTPLYRVVGGPLMTKGKRELLVCGRDEVRVLRRLDRHASAHNTAFDEAGRGSVLAVEVDPAHADRQQTKPSETLAVTASTAVRRLHGP